MAEEARKHGATRLYWTTKENNATARALYDKVTDFRGFIRYDCPLDSDGCPAPRVGGFATGRCPAVQDTEPGSTDEIPRLRGSPARWRVKSASRAGREAPGSRQPGFAHPVLSVL